LWKQSISFKFPTGFLSFKVIVPLLVGIIGWVWTDFVAQYKYQLLEINASFMKFFFLNLLISLACTFLFSRSLLKNKATRDKIKKWKKIYNVLITFLITGLLFFGAVMGFLLTINAVLDRQEKTLYTTNVDNVYIEKKSRSQRYWVIIDNIWQVKQGWYKISLSRKRYLDLDLSQGDRISIAIGYGAVGFPWIANI